MNEKIDRMDQLETTIMDLGAQLYQIRYDLQTAKKSSSHFLDVIKGLRMILDEKGLISQDDFDSAVDIVRDLNFEKSSEQLTENQREKDKKHSH